jgi:hypothetical protein
VAVIARVHAKIIANSTMSLWGALLGKVDDHVVFPSRWPAGGAQLPELCRSFGWIESSG